MTSDALSHLGESRYLRLTTFRRDGTPVPTPVWLVRDGDALLVTTVATTGKVKRLRHTPRVLVARCDYRGRVRPGEPEVEGVVEMTSDPAAVERLGGLLRSRYGLQYRVATFMERRRGASPDDAVVLRITLTAPEGRATAGPA